MVMDILEIVPDVRAVVQALLSSGFQSLNTATLTLETVDGKNTTEHHKLIRLSPASTENTF